MGDRRGRRGRKTSDERAAQPRRAHSPARRPRPQGVEVHGWIVLAHPLFLGQIEKLAVAVEKERKKVPKAPPSGSAKLLAHLLDLAFEHIPRDPGNPAYRQGGTLGDKRKHWFRAKTGNGRYRLFYRFHTAARIIVLAWVNDEQSLRSYGSRTDAYAVFARMLDRGNPPDDWDALVAAASEGEPVAKARALVEGQRRGRRRGT